MPIADDILTWAENRPAWQRDAIRRLLTAPELTDADLDELAGLCKATGDVVARPVTRADFGADVPEAPTVELLEVAEVRNVNAIRSDTPLHIAPEGITVIYGPNGSGKSGYIRLLKQLCRARGGIPTLLPNVYEERPGDPASARIRYSVDGVVQDCEWQEGVQPPDSLGSISIFDHECASIYTDENCTVAYLPLGLDLLARLADVCNKVRARLDAERNRLNEMAMVPVEVRQGTEAADVIAALDEEGARAKVEQFAVFDDVQTDRLRELERLLHEQNPTRRATELEGQARRIGDYTERLSALTSAVSDTAVEALKEGLRERNAARGAVRLASETAFANEPLSGTGGEPWRALWEAARRFASETARPDKGFPPGENEECLLCQQPLSGLAADRMRRFEAFIGSDLESQVRQWDTYVVGLRGALPESPAVRPDELQAELELDHPGVYGALQVLVPNAARRLRQMANAESEDELEQIASLDDEQVADRLQEIRGALRTEAGALRDSVAQGARQALEREHAELVGRQRVFQRRGDLLREVERRKQLRAIENARGDTVTTGITRKNTDLTAEYLTADLARNFGQTLRELRLDNLPIQVIGAPGDRGTAYHRLNIEADAAYGVRPGQVLSQGEHRCVALAAFLAEVATQSGASTIILDDPVSSLDHDRRNVVARRLAEIAAIRPILAFTHDMAFALALQRNADSSGVDLHLSRLLRVEGAVGRVAEDLPWHGMNVRRRMGHLRQLHQNAEVVRRGGDEDDYERVVKEIYGFLREAWERAVEEVLLNGAVERFAPDVQTLRLRRLADVTSEHMATLENGMSKSSRWLRGHDDPATIDDPVPEPAEMADDIDVLDTWRRDLQAVHQG